MEINKLRFKLIISTLFSAILFICADTSYAQIKVGATTGANFNSFGQPGVIIGGNVGAFGRYQVLDFLEAQAEIKYSLSGGGRHDMLRTFDFDQSQEAELNSIEYLNRAAYFHSLEIPLSARLGLPDLAESAISPKFIVGFSYAFIFNAVEQRDALYFFNNDTELLLSNVEENIGADINSSNFSYVIGFALDFTLDNGNVFTTEFRYQRGINNLNAVAIADPRVTENLYSQTFSLNFAYQIFDF